MSARRGSCFTSAAMSPPTVPPPVDPSTTSARAPDLAGVVAGAVRERRGLLWGIVLVIVLFYPLDDLFTDGPVLWALVVRLLWAGIFVLGLRRWARDGHEAESGWVFLLATASAISLVTLAALTGGVSSYIFNWIFLLPVIIGAIFPLQRGALVGAAACFAVGGVALLSRTAQPGMEIILFLPQLGVVTGIALFAQYQFAELLGRELAMAGDRETALAALVESEHRRSRAERLATLGQLAAGVAHEVNNPLAYLKANLAFVGELTTEHLPLEDRAELAEVLEESRIGLDRIAEIVRSLKLYARDDEEEHRCEVSAAVNEACQLASIRLRGMATLEKRLDPGLPTVPMAQGRLVQVVLNLLINAADAVATRAGAGMVLVEAMQLPGGNGVCLAVEDDGVGLSPEVRDRLFRPFFTTKPPGQGTGLGLSLAEEMITRVGGTITALDRPGGPGTRFEIELPSTAYAVRTGRMSAA